VLENNYWIFPIVFLLSLAISTFSVPLLKKLAVRFEILDKPNQIHKTHSVPIPYLGGLAIVIPVLFMSILSIFCLKLDNSTIIKGCLLIIPGLILAIVGLIDDKKNLSASSRFVIQLFVSSLISLVLTQVQYGVRISEYQTINFLISILWIVGITNAFNFVDNLDGGASGIAVISSASIFLLSLVGNQYLIASFSLTICAATLGFLFWNRNPATIYLGDSGALFIGLILSVLLLQFEPSATSKLGSISIPIMIMAVPIIDTSVAVISRFQRSKSIFQGGRDHLSHRILGLGLNKRQTAICIWTLGAFFALLGTLIDQLDIVNEELMSVVGLVGLLLVTIIFLRLPQFRIL
jgi:UDP-GlcNAc:undecaprenyl-phosphate/decaprenyl-phosphate GlcNAc-1-phosphate transferase